MNKPAAALALLGALTLVGAVGACSSEEGGAPASSDESGPAVTTKLLAFGPEELTVKAGTTVTWEVSDSIGHTVTTGTFELDGDGLRTSESPDGVIDSAIGPGQTASHTFAEPGTYPYYCSIHKGMSGVVEVTK